MLRARLACMLTCMYGVTWHHQHWLSCKMFVKHLMPAVVVANHHGDDAVRHIMGVQVPVAQMCAMSLAALAGTGCGDQAL